MQYIKHQFSNEKEKEELIAAYSSLQVHEIQYLVEGNFLVFRDEPILATPVYLVDDTNTIENLKMDRLITQMALAETIEKQEADKVTNQLALAELLETLTLKGVL